VSEEQGGGLLLLTIGLLLALHNANHFGIASFPAARRGVAIGAADTGVGLGAATSLAALPVLVELIGLTGALLSLAAFAAVMTVLAPRGLAIQRQARPRARATPRSVLGQREFLCLLDFSFLGFFTTYALLTWLPAYLSSGLGVRSVAIINGVPGSGPEARGRPGRAWT